jgi:hypothetical protein
MIETSFGARLYAASADFFSRRLAHTVKRMVLIRAAMAVPMRLLENVRLGRRPIACPTHSKTNNTAAKIEKNNKMR